MHHRVNTLGGERALECGRVSDIPNAEVRARIDVRAVARREIVDDDDLIATRKKRVDDMTPEESRTAGHKDTQSRAAPSVIHLRVDEVVEEMVDKSPTRRRTSTLASGSRGSLPPRRVAREGHELFRTSVLESPT